MSIGYHALVLGIAFVLAGIWMFYDPRLANARRLEMVTANEATLAEKLVSYPLGIFLILFGLFWVYIAFPP